MPGKPGLLILAVPKNGEGTPFGLQVRVPSILKLWDKAYKDNRLCQPEASILPKKG